MAKVTKRGKFYIGLLAATAVLFLCFGSAFLLALLIFGVLLFFALLFFLHMDVKSLQLQTNATSAVGMREKSGRIKALIWRRHKIIALSRMEMTIQYHNKMLNRSEERQMKIDISDNRHTLSIPFLFHCCGQTEMKWDTMLCYDIFGLWVKPFSYDARCTITVYPKPLPLRFSVENQAFDHERGENVEQNRRGKDPYEIFDLREYHTGDDIRAIHWKLSGKTNRLMVKESGDSTYYDILILVDIGQQKGEVPLKKELISYGMELGISVSHELLKIGIPHQIAVPTEDHLLYFNMANSTDYIHMLDSCMKLTLPKQSNTALTFFLSEKRPTYTKIIYLTVSDYEQSMIDMLYNTDVTILCVGDKEKQTMVEQGDKLHIIELSEASLENEQLTIAL